MHAYNYFSFKRNQQFFDIAVRCNNHYWIGSLFKNTILYVYFWHFKASGSNRGFKPKSSIKIFQLPAVKTGYRTIINNNNKAWVKFYVFKMLINSQESSLDCSIWHSFCLFFLQSSVFRPYKSFLLMSLTVEERNERENWLFPPLLVHFVSNTLCSRLQHTHFSRQIFKRIYLFHLLSQKVPVST